MNHIYIFLTGIALGWLIGMSESPVVSGVITSIVSIVIILVSILSGINNYQKKSDNEDQTNYNDKLINSIRPLPIFLLVMGISIGAASGIFTRTNELLGKKQNKKVFEKTIINRPIGIPLDSLLSKYRKHGIPDSIIVDRVLNIELPEDASMAKPELILRKEHSELSTEKPINSKPVLFNIQTSICTEFCSYNDDDILYDRLKFYAKAYPNIKTLISEYKNDKKGLIDKFKTDCKCH